MSEERLQKILARAGVASRRKVEELIREARVTINGRMAEIGDKADLERDAVKLDGKRIQPKAGGHHYLLLNKPRGVMSTLQDPEGRPTVLDLVPPGMRKALVPVGRLDFLTEGLLLLTDDGEFAQHVAHPRYGCVKTYEVKVKGHPEEADISRLEAGIVLDGKRTSPCRITARPVPRRAADLANSWWYVELSEGRTRQIREMFERIGHPVQKLRRIAIGPVADAKLPVGALRELTEREVEQLLRSSRDRPAASVVKRLAPPKPPKAAAKSATKRPAAGRKDERPAGKTARPATKRPAAPRGGKAAAAPAKRRPAGAPASRTTSRTTSRRSPAGPSRGPRGASGTRGGRSSR
jgi:23S rRNA pseudouridine2605 synthase